LVSHPPQLMRSEHGEKCIRFLGLIAKMYLSILYTKIVNFFRNI